MILCIVGRERCGLTRNRDTVSENLALHVVTKRQAAQPLDNLAAPREDLRVEVSGNRGEETDRARASEIR